MKLFSRIHRQDEGVAIILVMGVILVAGLLAATAITASSNLVNSSLKDTRNTRALGAAQAGADIAMYRATKMAPTAEQCVTTDGKVSWQNTQTPKCPATASGALGNGATYKFYVTPEFGTTNSPFNTSGAGSASANLAAAQTVCGAATGERCLTAIGTVGGVSRRIQLRVKGSPLFPIVGGLVGLHAANWMANNSWSSGNTVPQSDVGSNDRIYMGGSQNTGSDPGGNCVHPSTIVGSKNACTGGQTVMPIGVPSVDSLPWDAAKASNNNATIPVGYLKNTATSTIPWLVVPAGITLSLASGTYDFCSIYLNDGARLVAQPGATVEIYLDSVRRNTVQSITNGCPTTTPSGAAAGQLDGDFYGGPGSTTSGSAGSTLLDGTSTGRLSMYLYGTKAPAPKGTLPYPGASGSESGSSPYTWSGCGDDFDWRNMFSSPVAANNVYIFAPNSNVKIASNALIYGGISACTASFWSAASSAGFTSPVTSITPPPGPVAAVTGTFKECRANALPSTTDVSYAGCSG